MIPASYLFKQAYDQAWNEPETIEVVEVEKPAGLFMPILAAVRALLSRRPQIHSQSYGSHAYE